MSDLAHVLQDTRNQLASAEERIAFLEKQMASHPANEHLYRDVIDTIADYLCRYTPDLLLTFANHTYCVRLGKSEQELIGHCILDWIPETEHEAARRHMETITPENPVAIVIRPVINPDGTKTWVEWRDMALFDADGRIAGYQAIGRDVSKEHYLRQQVAQQNAILQQSHDLIGLTDLQGRILFINHAGAAMFGYDSPQEVIGRSSSEFYSSDKVQYFSEIIIPTLPDGQWYGENQIRNRDGKLIDVEQSIFLIREDGRPSYYASIMRDITEQKSARQELQQSQERFSRMFELLPTGIAVIHRDTRHFIEVNDHFMKQIGYSRHELIGHSAVDVGLLQQVAITPEIAAEVDRQGVSTGHEIELERKSGETLYAILSVVSIELENKPCFMLAIEDITPRKLQELALQQSEARQRALIRSIPDLIFRTNSDAVFLDYHAPEHQILAVQPQEFIGKSTTEVMPPDIASRHLLATRQVLETGQVVHFEYTLEIAGVNRSFEARVAPVSADELLLIVREITERRQAEEALRAAHATLEARVRERTHQLEAVTMQIEAIVNNSGDGIALIDSAYNVQQMNNAFRMMFGIPIDQEAGYSLMQLTFGEATQALTWSLIEVAATGLVRRIELPLRGVAGTLIDVETSISRVNLQNRPDASFVCIFRDVSERKRSELVIAEERNLLRTLIDSVPDYIYAKDLQHRFILANLALARRFGFDRWEDIIGKTDWQLYSADQAEKFVMAERQIFESGEPQLEHEDRVIFESDEEGWILTNKVVLRTLSGEVQGLVGITRDITERKRTEAILDQKYDDERQLQHYLRIMHAIMIELAMVESLDGFYRRTVELGVEMLNLDRVALFLYDPDRKYALCTYAVDRYGKVVHVPDLQFPVGNDGVMQHALLHPSHTYVVEDANLVDNHEVVGRGWNAGASLWHGDQVIGWIAVDNLLRQEPISAIRLEVISQYGVLVSSLLARKQVEQALRHSEDLYRSVVTSMTEGVVVQANDGSIEASNAAAERILGLTIEQMSGRTSLDPRWKSVREDGSPFPGEQHPAMVTLRTGEAISNVVMGVHKPDEENITWISINSQPIFRNHTSIPDAVVATFTDITSRKMAQDALRESEAKYRQLIETMGGGVTMSNLQNDLIYANDRFCEIVGLTREQILGQELMSHVVSSDLDLVSDHRSKREKGESSSYEMTIERPDGRLVTVLVSGSPMVDLNGVRSGSFAVSVDITAQKEAEEALRRALEREKELGQLKTQFVSTTSHEFRTPLATILATTETLMHYRNRLDEEQITARLDKIRKQVNHLRQIMDDVLQLARIQARRVEFRPALGDLHKLCEEIVEEFNSGTENRDRVRYHAPDDDITMVFDPRLMRQVVNNLVSNALKYSDKEKHVDLTLSREGEQVVIVVQDYGIGFPQESMPHLFEPFHRANNVGTIPGTGLGLPIVKESVEMHGGTITLQSELAVGSILTVHLPFRDTLPEEAEPEEEIDL
jgi:PAS domain S-box-containing protein